MAKKKVSASPSSIPKSTNSRSTKARAKPRPANSVAMAKRFDTADLARALDVSAESPDDLAMMFANEVNDRIYPATAAQIYTFDPSWIMAIAELVMKILTDCKKPAVTTALRECQHRPNGLKARATRIRLAARLPWKEMPQRFQVAKAILEAGVANVDSEFGDKLWSTVEPPTSAEPDRAVAASGVGAAGGV